MIPVLTERLNNCERGLHNTGAARCSNHAGIRSKPVAVGHSLSRSLKTSQSVTTLSVIGVVSGLHTGMEYCESVDMVA